MSALETLIEDLRTAGIDARGLEVRPGFVALQIGDDEDAVLGVEVSDPARPAFAVSYPAVKAGMKPGANRRGQVETVHREGVLFDGVLWIARQLAAHGAVRPEYPSPSG
jgi:hypothetical protein